MEFCPECGSMMLPFDNGMKCRKCGYIKEREGTNLILKKRRIERDLSIIEGSEDLGLPTINMRCQECGNNRAYWWLRQLRSADEGEVRFFRCTKCGKTWREYN
ncbi:MAG: transcription factor S [Methanosarcinales archaeon Met12]|nr:MAG: transcription factor S [Methanosarcinales archaeon Met12]